MFLYGINIKSPEPRSMYNITPRCALPIKKDVRFNQAHDHVYGGVSVSSMADMEGRSADSSSMAGGYSTVH